MILGLDLSTSIIGLCSISKDKKLHSLSFLNLKKEKDLFAKALAFKNELEKIAYNGQFKHIAIEEAFVKFKPGKSSAQTLAKLSTFNGMCAVIAYFTTGIKPVYYNVNNARITAFDGIKFPMGCDRKMVIQSQVAKLWPQVDWPIGLRTGKLIKQCYDMADAAVIALCHAENLKKAVYNESDSKT